MSLAQGGYAILIFGMKEEFTGMGERKFVSSKDYNKDLAKSLQFGYTIAQWIMAIAITTLGAISLLVAGVLSMWGGAWVHVVCAAEFTILLVVGLAGGLIPKGDYPIHMIGEELAQVDDWHENLRSLYRKPWLNFLPDMFGLLPALFLFAVANVLIYRYWRFDFSVELLMFGNCVLLGLSVAMIPLVCGMAHVEVKKQIGENEALKPKQKPNSLQ